jgi:hypothetical protein
MNCYFIYNNNRIVSIGGDIKYTAGGIYAHLLFSRNSPNELFVYIGQAEDLCYRIVEQHCNAWYRVQHRSLHYHFWDSHPD